MMKEIQHAIEIKASKEKIWKILWSNATYRDWADMIDEGLYMKGSLKEGKEIEFISSVDGYGVTSLVAELIPNEYVLFKHRADTKGSDMEERKNEWAGGTESYALKENEGVTQLIVKIDVPIELEKLFNERLPKALERIKTLAE